MVLTDNVELNNKLALSDCNCDTYDTVYIILEEIDITIVCNFSVLALFKVHICIPILNMII